MHTGRSLGEPRHAPQPPYDVTNGISYPNGRHHPVNQRAAHGASHMQWQDTSGVHVNNGQRQFSTPSSTSSHQHDRSVHSHYERNQYSRYDNNSHYGRESQHDVRRVAPVQGYPRNNVYAAPPVTEIPVAGHYVQNLPRAHGGYHPYNNQQWQPRYGTDRGAPTNPQAPVGRSYGNNNQPNNHYSALNRGGSNRGHGRY